MNKTNKSQTNLSINSTLKAEAIRQDINLSKFLEESLKNFLDLQEPKIQGLDEALKKQKKIYAELTSVKLLIERLQAQKKSRIIFQEEAE